MKDVQFHEAANIFPLMTGDDFDSLVEDIRKHGLRETIKTLDGLIIDGRNRYRACLQAGVAGRYEEIKTNDPIAYVSSLNKHRRHLTATQLAMVAAKAKEFYEKEAKERQKRKPTNSVPVNLPEQKGDARDKAGKEFGVSGKSVDNATRVLENGTPELIEAVEQDRIAVSTAARLATRSEEEQREVINRSTNGKRRIRPTEQDEPEAEQSQEARSKSKAIERANEAINALKRIPKNDALRNRGFQIVSDWIKANK